VTNSSPTHPFDPHNDSLVDEIRAYVSARLVAMPDEEISRQITVLWSLRRRGDGHPYGAVLASFLSDALDEEWSRRHPSDLVPSDLVPTADPIYDHPTKATKEPAR
jgi:hypothetical protein